MSNIDKNIEAAKSIAEANIDKRSTRQTQKLNNVSLKKTSSLELSLSTSNDDSNTKVTRRDFMVLTATSMASIGAVSSLWPFIDSLNPAANVSALSSVEVDIDKIQCGQAITISWQGKPVFIKHRTDEEIKEARAVNLSELIDPEEDNTRVKSGYDQWLVVIGICTHLGCIPTDRSGEYNGWFCPCHGSHYDTSGRIRKGPAPKNLEIPPYQFITDKKIKIG